MLNKKIIVPIVGAILVALGVNLEQLGIDLNDFTGNNNDSGGSSSSSASQSNNNSNVATIASKNSNTQAYKPGKKWSDTNPAINLHHVFEGEINRKGKPVGYHSRPGGNDPDTARIVRIKDKPNRAGVYTANIEIRDGNQWKGKFSSFFPDNLSQQQVTDLILKAYRNSKDKNKQPWQGASGLGFDVQGYTMSRGDINTAFPIYRRDN